MASRRRAQESELSSIGIQECPDAKSETSRKAGQLRGFSSYLSRVALMTQRLDFKSVRFLFVYTIVCFSLALLFILNSQSRPAQDHTGYPVIDDHECGNDEERISNVFVWAKKNGAYISPHVSSGMFPIPGTRKDCSSIEADDAILSQIFLTGDRSGAMVRGLRATGSLRKGQQIFVMPKHLLLNLRMVRRIHLLLCPRHANVTTPALSRRQPQMRYVTDDLLFPGFESRSQSMRRLERSQQAQPPPSAPQVRDDPVLGRIYNETPQLADGPPRPPPCPHAPPISTLSPLLRRPPLRRRVHLPTPDTPACWAARRAPRGRLCMPCAKARYRPALRKAAATRAARPPVLRPPRQGCQVRRCF